MRLKEYSLTPLSLTVPALLGGALDTLQLNEEIVGLGATTLILERSVERDVTDAKTALIVRLEPLETGLLCKLLAELLLISWLVVEVYKVVRTEAFLFGIEDEVYGLLKDC